MNGVDVTSFMGGGDPTANANTPWGQAYGRDLRKIIEAHQTTSPRSVQVHLGPSELGVECDRQVAGKFAGLPVTNHVVDPWPSIVGTAVHAWLSDAFTTHNATLTAPRFVAEQRVTPHPDHAGTADLYDAQYRAVVDWKVLGETPLAKLRNAGEPPRHYRVQLLLYGLGYINLGLPVARVVLVALPRTKATLDTMYVWDHQIDADTDAALLSQVFHDTARRRTWGEAVARGQLRLMDVPARPSGDGCYFCPFYRPDSAQNTATPVGCPGTLLQNGAAHKTIGTKRER